MPRYPYRDLGTELGRDFRNNLNANFDDIEADLRDIQNDLDSKESRITQIENDSIERDNDLDARIDNLVLSAGDSSPEVADARYDSRTNTTYTTLKDRLDSHSNEIGILSNVVISLEKFPIIAPEADDTGRFQRALDSLNTGGELIVPKGNYNVKRVNINYDNITITIHPSAFLKFVATAGTEAMFKAEGRNNILIRGGRFDGNDVDMYGKGLIYFKNCTNSVVERCYITNVYRKDTPPVSGSCAILFEGTKHCYAIRNKIIDSGYGIVVGTLSTDGSPTADYNVIEGNYIEDTRMDSIFVTASLSSVSTTNKNTGNKILNNTVKTCYDCGIESGINNNACIISGNHVYGSSGPNIMIRNNEYTIVEGNYSYGSTGDSLGYGGGINVNSQVPGTNRNIVISNNVCEGNTGDGILVQQTTRNVTISGNACRNNGGRGIVLNVGAFACSVTGNTVTNNGLNGIYVLADGQTGNGRNTISGNVVANNGSSGIYIDSQYNTITENNCYDDQGTKTQTYGIYLSGGSQCNFNLVDSNNVYGNLNGGIWVGSTTGVGNVISENNHTDSRNHYRENSGYAYISVGTTRTTVNHGLIAAPKTIELTPTRNLGSVWIEYINATSFDIVCSTAPTGSSAEVRWRARV